VCYAPRNYSAQGQAKEEFQDDLYAYDPAGNLLSDQDKTGGQWQCYGYDHFPRLAQAWTTTGSDGCAGGVRGYTPAATGAYQQSYSYDIAGNTTAVTTGLTTPAKTITRYTYPEPVQAHPHAPVTVGATSFAYDSDGNLTRQVTGQARQLYDWDSQGQLTTVTAWQHGHKGAQVASFAYGSDGNRIIRRDPGGATTLYLPGTELASDGTTLTATRYYSVGGTTIGTRTTSPGVTGGVVTWLTGNPQGSPQYAITATTGKPFGRQRYLPYGGLNGGRTISVTSRAFLGQPLDDSTGLIADGARYYNPATGQFISPDPIIDPADPGTLNAYAYADGNPATWTDPTGLITGGITAPGGQICTPEVLAAGDCGHTSGSGTTTTTTTSPFTGGGCNPYVESCGGSTSVSSAGGGCNPYVENCGGSSGNGQAPGTSLLPVKAQSGYQSAYYSYAKSNDLTGPLLELGALNAYCSGNLWSDWGCGKRFSISLLADYEDTAKYSVGLDLGGFGDAGEFDLDELEAVQAGAADDIAQLGCGASFTASTRVLLASGKTMPISQLKPGDIVLATSTKTGNTQAETITAVLVHRDSDLLDLKIRADGRIAVIQTTSSHLFWVPRTPGSGYWVSAGSLRYGTRLRTPAGDGAKVAGSWRPAVRTGWMWDLTIPGNNDHTFYVEAGSTPVLVHNSSCSSLYQGNGFQHVLYEHVSGSPGVAGDNTVFSGYLNTNDIADLIEETVSAPDVITGNTIDPATGLQRDGAVYIRDFGEEAIGETQNGDPLYRLRVVLNPDGSIRTAFPIG